MNTSFGVWRATGCPSVRSAAWLLPAFGAALVAAAMLLPGLSRAAGNDDKSNSPPNVLDGRELVNALRGGGHVIYFRHGRTDLSTQDTDRDNLANCATQRRLSDEGRQEMVEIGRRFQELGLRVSSVLASPYCRAIDTARLGFGKVTIEPELKHTVTADEATAKRQAQALRALLATVPAAQTNAVLAGHTGNLQEATGIWPSPEGVAIVFRPDGKGGFSYVATLPPARWAELAAAERKAPSK